MSSYESYESRVAKALGLRVFGAGNRDIETETGELQSVEIKMIWAADYSIDAEEPIRGLVGVMHTDVECRGICLPPRRMGEKEPYIKPVILKNWSDPVIGALKSINVIPLDDKRWWHGGFSFDLYLVTSAWLNTKISFNDSVNLDPTIEWLWDSITETAAKIFDLYDDATKQHFYPEDGDYTIPDEWLE